MVKNVPRHSLVMMVTSIARKSVRVLAVLSCFDLADDEKHLKFWISPLAVAFPTR